MKLYPKKLHNISDLEREKEVLRYAQKQVSLDSLFSLGGLTGTAAKPKETSSNATTGTNLGIATMILDLVLKYAMPNRRQVVSKRTEERTERPRKNLLISAAKEFIGGYIKWKVVELSYKGLSKVIRSRKEPIKK